MYHLSGCCIVSALCLHWFFWGLLGAKIENEFQMAALFASAVQVMDDGNRYDGGFDHLNFMREGLGTMSYVNGSSYDGSWVHDERHGQGTMRYACGDVYVGCWRRGFRHGRGKRTYFETGCTYDGLWVDGKRQGHGEWVDARTGEKYLGTWHADERDGTGYLRLPSGPSGTGDTYEGEFSAGRMHGLGEWTSGLTGNKRRGYWRDGVVVIEGLPVTAEGQTGQHSSLTLDALRDAGLAHTLQDPLPYTNRIK